MVSPISLQPPPTDLSCQLLVRLATLNSIEMRRLSELCILLLIVAGEGAVSQYSQRRQYSYYRGRQLGTVSRVRQHHDRHQQVMLFKGRGFDCLGVCARLRPVYRDTIIKQRLERFENLHVQ